MRRLFTIICVALLFASLSGAQSSKAPSPAHASREAAVALLRHEGILHGETRVVSAQWNGDLWVISLRHPSGTVSNWTVDASAENYAYVCKH